MQRGTAGLAVTGTKNTVSEGAYDGKRGMLVSRTNLLSRLLILVAVGFLAFQLLSKSNTGGPAPVEQVTVPNFIGMSIDQAKTQAAQFGIELLQTTFQVSDQPANTILDQDPKQNARIDKGGTVRLTLAAGAVTVGVPDLRGLTESQAIQSILAAGLAVGDRTDGFDPVVPIGSVISQDPRTGLQVSRPTAVNYVVSKGPESTLSPSPSPAIAGSIRLRRGAGASRWVANM